MYISAYARISNLEYIKNAFYNSLAFTSSNLTITKTLLTNKNTRYYYYIYSLYIALRQNDYRLLR